MEIAVWLVGESFDPDRGLASYHTLPLQPRVADQIERALEAAKAILGRRTRDIVYSLSRHYLRESVPGWDPRIGPLPATQPPARWWRAERTPWRSPNFMASVFVAFEDEVGEWWVYDPKTKMLYRYPLASNYYGESLDARLTSISPAEARRLIESGLQPLNHFPRPADGRGFSLEDAFAQTQPGRLYDRQGQEKRSPSLATGIDRLLSPPATHEEARAWMAIAVWLVGEEFDPDRSFATYNDLPLLEQALSQLDRALATARTILGERARDIAYRESRLYLHEAIPGYNPLSGPLPATQPPARWWRGENMPPLGGSPPVFVAYEDEIGNWWVYDPISQRLHDMSPLYTSYYHSDGDLDEGIRLTKITPDLARELMASDLQPFERFPGPAHGEGLSPQEAFAKTPEVS
jgi:hypothetical protein